MKRRTTDTGAQDGSDKDADKKKRTKAVKGPYKKVTKTYGTNESWNFHISDTQITGEFISRMYSKRKVVNFIDFVAHFLIGMFAALAGSVINTAVSTFAKYRIRLIHHVLENEGTVYPVHTSFGIWITNSVLLAFISSCLVTYLEPRASGGGAIFIKVYLNGLHMDGHLTLKTLFTKLAAVSCALSAGLPGGAEGPMVHIGGIIGAKVCSLLYNIEKLLKLYPRFKDDYFIKDFVLAGVAAGVGSGFKAPIGAVLFALEEAASYWNYKWIVLSLIASSISFLFTHLFLSLMTGGEITYGGEFKADGFEQIQYSSYEIPIFMLLGIIGGLLGALWAEIYYLTSSLRKKLFVTQWLKILEVVVFAILYSSVMYVILVVFKDCVSNKPINIDVKELICPDGKTTTMKHLLLDAPDHAILSLFSNSEKGPMSPKTLAIFFVFYFLASSYASGLRVSLGTFVPQILLGAVWGRCIGELALIIFPDWKFIIPAKYALIGAAAQLAGVLRMTVSLSVILLEITSISPSFISPLVITLVCSKLTADLIVEGILEKSMKEFPIIPWHPFKCTLNRNAAEIMSSPAVCFFAQEKVSYIYQVLKNTTHSGFPVVKDTEQESPIPRSGILIGFMLREVLVFILEHKCYEETQDTWIPDVASKLCYDRSRRNQFYVPEPDESEVDFTIDFTLFMNQSPFRVPNDAYVPAIFTAFRGLCLRHVVVVDTDNRTVGIITREDFLCE